MLSIFRITLIFCILTFFSNSTNAQPTKGQSIDVEIGYGISIPYASSSEAIGSGFYAQGEYALGITKWFGIRPYAGVILTWPDNNDNTLNQDNLEVTSRAFLIGGKIRLAAPIPWVAPFIEFGIGASIGSFKNFDGRTENIEKSGIIDHYPFTLGLAIGRNHNYEFSFAYYYQPEVEQFVGAITLGYSFPLD
ncbi:hypothetical protein [uncultured Aquimarina sp.]|uniref:hypothetical protein n=1 Tax=uncultured Aquimarina sp. TaxID=575652 RepID=UPI002627DC62|nr:hypothetical protein [uncultured Aquimarina sp.]